MQPPSDGYPVSPFLGETPSPSLQARDIDVDLSSSAPVSYASSTRVNAASATPADGVGDGLEHQSRDFLLQRVRALEQQLTVRNGDCARLLAERQQLLPLKEKCESQREMILALRGELDLAKAQRESAVDAMETMKRRQRDQEHRDRVQHAERAMYGASGASAAKAAPAAPAMTSTTLLSPTQGHPGVRPATAAPNNSGHNSNSNSNNATATVTNGVVSPKAPSPSASSSTPNIGRRNPGGTVVSTAAGPQLLYDSSDISSVGFTKNAKLPYDFLGGPGAQQQYLARYSGGGGSGRGDEPDGGHDESEDGQVRRVIAAAKDQADMEAKYAEMEDKEEEALMARIKALREGRK